MQDATLHKLMTQEDETSFHCNFQCKIICKHILFILLCMVIAVCSDCNHTEETLLHSAILAKYATFTPQIKINCETRIQIPK